MFVFLHLKFKGVIRISQINFSYSQKKIFDGLSFSVAEGDFCAMIGPNGSGKTTLLKIMAGLLDVQSGKVEICGKERRSRSAVDCAKMMAYVAQKQNVAFDFSVFDTVMMGRFPYQKRWENATERDRAIVTEVLHQTGLWELKERMFSQLSGGEAQRVMIARAMAQQTPIILLDEPLSNLDISHQFEVMDLLQNLNKQKNTTIIIVMHDFSFAKLFATQTMMLQNGNLRFFGPTNDVLTTENIRACFNLNTHFSLDSRGHVSRD